MDYAAEFDESEDQIDLNKNEVQVEKKNYKRKVMHGSISICACLLFCIGILFGLNQIQPAENLSPCNATIHNCNSTSFANVSQLDSTIDRKRQFIQEMMLDAWSAYERHAWGHGELSPVKKSASRWQFGKYPGLSIVGSMSSLWTMELKDEFEKGKKWIETELDLSKVTKIVGVFDVAVHYVGGLLSCYALTSEQLFLDKALTIAQLIEPAFNTSTGMPYHYISPNTSASYSYSQTYLSSVSGFQLDFNYLSDASGDDKYRKQIQKIQNVLKGMGNQTNLYFAQIDIEGMWKSDTNTNLINLFSVSREFYISLVKSFIQSNHRDIESIEMYKKALDALDLIKIFEESPGGMVYARGYYNASNSYENSMEYSGCYLGAMLSIGANAMQRALTLNSTIGDQDKVIEQNRIARHWHLAQQITRTCQQTSERTTTGLGPEQFYFNQTHDAIAKHLYYGLTPELAESNFILWRLTHNQKYRDNAWQMVQAIHRHCRVESGGYSTIKDVNQVPSRKTPDHQQALFLSATLYLTFTDDSVLSLEQFVFNSVGHPLPICGNNTMYPVEKCKL